MRDARLRSLISVFVVAATSLYVAAQYQHPEFHAAGLSPEYRKWLDEDVRWIVTPPERNELISLSSDEQRAQFVIAFWERRNPTPRSKENPFKEEHYKRLAFSNRHFAAGVAGWKTDRGRVYVVYGPPPDY